MTANTSTLDYIFSALSNDATEQFDYGFTSDHDMDNIEAMAAFLEEHGLESAVWEDDGTSVTLHHLKYDFPVVVQSYGGGDFFTHCIDVYRDEDADAAYRQAQERL